MWKFKLKFVTQQISIKCNPRMDSRGETWAMGQATLAHNNLNKTILFNKMEIHLKKKDSNTVLSEWPFSFPSIFYTRNFFLIKIR